MPLTDEEIDRLARKRTNAKLGWYMHLAIYVVVNLFIFAMSQHAFGQRPWSVYPLLGWGLGVVLHGLSVFVLGSGSGLRERMEEREREALRRRQ
ncbi:2TM domain-containing protein [Ramlibacter sp.]|uniref:2TM domain-containing protein n=1 Tax=Ramlibacter sp. TaxID=1917967 RepID=UPI0035AFA38D